jgi:hypothetical protein
MDMSSVLKQEDEFITINDERHLLKVKIKHLAAEARIIREEERQHSGMKKWGLQNHRKTTVRQAARQTQFAYAVIRGRTLERTAGKYGTKISPIQRLADERAVNKMVIKYGDSDVTYNTEAWFRRSADESTK